MRREKDLGVRRVVRYGYTNKIGYEGVFYVEEMGDLESKAQASGMRGGMRYGIHR